MYYILFLYIYFTYINLKRAVPNQCTVPPKRGSETNLPPSCGPFHVCCAHLHQCYSKERVEKGHLLLKFLGLQVTFLSSGEN